MCDQNDSYDEFETVTYSQIWHLAYGMGVAAKKNGLPRNCNLKESQFVMTSGSILRVYKSAWEQGWDEYKIPAIFKQTEAVLNNMPMRPMTETVVGYKLTRPGLGGWIHLGTKPREVADAIRDELDINKGMSAEECGQMVIEAYNTTQDEIDALPEFEGW